MFAQLTWKGLGAHDETITLQEGENHLRRPSGSAKSTLLRAMSLLLTGKEPDGQPLEKAACRGVIIQDGAKATRYTAWIEGTTHGGTVLRRTWDAESKPSRFLRLKGVEVDVGTEAKWTAAMGKYLRPNVRLILAPMAWVRLEGETQGRPLRDLLLALVWPDGTADACRELVRRSDAWQDGDPVDITQAEEARRVAGRRLTGVDGQLAEARKRFEDASRPVPTVTEDEVAAARRIIQDAARVETHREGVRLAETWERYQTGLAALGDEPPIPPSMALQEARAAVAHAETALRKAESSYGGSQALQRQAAERVEALQDEITPISVCPHCRREWPEGHSDSQAREVARLAKLADAEKVLAQASAGLASAGAEVEEATSRVAEKREATEALINQIAVHSAWIGHRNALGPRPWEKCRPPALDCAAPSPEEVRVAEETIKAADVATGAKSQAADALDLARARVEQVEAERESARAEHERLGRLVDAVRAAPAALLPRAIEALESTGLLGDVSLVAGEGLSVYWRGRPWYVASGGERVLLDVHLRAALRGVGRLDQLEIVVDNAQDYAPKAGEPAYPAGGNSVWLWTEK